MMYVYLYSGGVDRAADWTEKTIEDCHPALNSILSSATANEPRASPRWPKPAKLMSLAEA